MQVVQYNILNPKLTQNLNTKLRFTNICSKLQSYIYNGAVICLQEVPEMWICKFNDFFAENGYKVIYTLYGPPHQDYMGICICYPQIYTKVKGKIIHVAKYLPEPVKYNCVTQYFRNLLGFVDQVKIAKSRPNKLLCITINNIVIANYHMPCLFKFPEAMALHMQKVFELVNNYAGEKKIIFAGDFNTKPTDTNYNIPFNYGFNSAYGINLEPEYTTKTNYFTGCLDYIFYKNAICTYTQLLNLNGCEMPNNTEPSDHLLLCANFT